MKHNDCLYVATESQETLPGNILSLQNYFQTNCRSVTAMLLKTIGTTPGQ